MTEPSPAAVERRAVYPLVAVSASCFLGVGAVLPVLPVHVTRTLDGSGSQLGLVLAAFPVAALLGRFLAGSSSDRRGRAWTLRVGLITTVVSGLLLALPLPLPGLVLARGVHGLAEALLYGAAAAWVVDVVAPERRAQSLALLGTGVWGGSTVGTLLGGLLGTLPRVGLAVAVLAAIGLVLLARAGDPPPVAPRSSAGGRFPPGLLLPGLAVGFGNLGFAAVAGFLVLHVGDRGGSGTLVLTVFTAAVLVGRLAVVPVAVRLGMLRSLPVATLAMAGALVVLAGAEGTLVPALAVTALALGYCLPYPAIASVVTARVPPDRRGAALGALVAFYDLAVGLASLVYGPVADRAGTGAVFLTAAGGVGVAVVLVTALGWRERTRAAALQLVTEEPAPAE